ncbi:MAG: outer membrane lipoprotein LolB [Porticoccaceae bacterium]|jgi:outer membrane lipoprotein LolB|nr:outer membrane lipoprotein LolB [Porticoccaceae bacterium]MBT7374611.1 outer membrane lipoprotein LolB [Porticoccaceae bacterium]
MRALFTLRALFSLRALCLIAACFMAGCSSQSMIQSSNTGSWQDHKLQVGQFDQWQLQGKLGFKNASQGGSANLKWLQNQQYYKLYLSGPLGAGSAVIEGDETLAKMRQGSQTFSDSPEFLALKLTGLAIPVDALSWWARGLPSPSKTAISNLITGPTGTAASFEQAGWQLSFSRYSQNQGIALPGKITGQLGDQSFKLVISGWSVPDN